ncbi:MAG: hypothetical protein AAFV80_22895, partial [Bacteroidota bacterium]
EKIWMKFCFGAIRAEKLTERNRLQKIKDNAFYKMKEFKSISKNKIRRSRSSSEYPSIANFDIIKLNDKIFTQTDDVFKAFEMKFQEFEKDILEKWSDEVEQEMVKTQE